MNGQRFLEPIEANSSPRRITAAKGSSVWLHWNYTYVGDGTHGGTTTLFANQFIVDETTSPIRSQMLALKLGQNGPFRLMSSVPAPFTGRLEMISSNSTLVIHDLQYNDSNHRFFSRAILHIGRSSRQLRVNLRPVVTITVRGM